MDTKRIYVDHSATTPIRREVFEAMLPYLQENFGNPSSVYKEGREAKKAINTARQQVADAIGAEIGEIFFTGSGSEADNWAIKGTAYALKDKGNHIISTKIEHHAILHPMEALERRVTLLPTCSRTIWAGSRRRISGSPSGMTRSWYPS